MGGGAGREGIVVVIGVEGEEEYGLGAWGGDEGEEERERG